MSGPVRADQDGPPLAPQAPAQAAPNDESSGQVKGKPATRFDLGVIRQHCAECIYAPKDVSRCDRADCPLWPFREGTKPRQDQTEATALLAVARFCNVVCCEGDREQVRECPATDCALWPWRKGQTTMQDGRPVPQAQQAAKAVGMTPLERACLEAGQVVERLCPRKCDRCRRRARREAWRREKRRQRSAARIPRPTEGESRRP